MQNSTTTTAEGIWHKTELMKIMTLWLQILMQNFYLSLYPQTAPTHEQWQGLSRDTMLPWAILAFLWIQDGWWRGVVCNASQMKRSYSMPGPVSIAMGDCLRAGKPSRCEACQRG